MTKLSVNINKIATLRNARGGNVPDLLQAALNCEQYGAEGITVHPRPDERHIRYQDVYDLKPHLTTEFNIEGYPNDAFIQLVLDNKPAQVTLVPDGPDVLTSNAGWDTIEYASLLTDCIKTFKEAGIRTSVFMECNEDFIEGAAKVGADRIELYTEDYAVGFEKDRENAVAPYVYAAEIAGRMGLGVNAGHDLNQENLQYFASQVPGLLEVSIGHALISEALYLGLENTIQLYRRKLEISILEDTQTP
jgi:pyridoxine 5-phosphate synthase